MSDERGAGRGNDEPVAPPVKPPARLPSGGWSQVPDLEPPAANRPMRDDATWQSANGGPRSSSDDREISPEPEVVVDADVSSLGAEPDWDDDQEAFLQAAFESRPPADTGSSPVVSESPSAVEMNPSPEHDPMNRPLPLAQDDSTQIGRLGATPSDSGVSLAPEFAGDASLIGMLDAYAPWADEADVPQPSGVIDDGVNPSAEPPPSDLVIIDPASISLQPLSSVDAGAGEPTLGDGPEASDTGGEQEKLDGHHPETVDPAMSSDQNPEPPEPQMAAADEHTTVSLLRPSTWFGGRRKRGAATSEVDADGTVSGIGASRTSDDPVPEHSPTTLEPSVADHALGADEGRVERAGSSRDSADFEVVESDEVSAPLSAQAGVGAVDAVAESPADYDSHWDDEDGSVDELGPATGEDDDSADAVEQATPATDSPDNAGARNETPESQQDEGLPDTVDASTVASNVDVDDSAGTELDASAEREDDGDAAGLEDAEDVDAEDVDAAAGVEGVEGADPVVGADEDDEALDAGSEAAAPADSTDTGYDVAASDGVELEPADAHQVPPAPPVAAISVEHDPNSQSWIPTPEHLPLHLHQPEIAGGPPEGRHNWVTRQDLFETQKRGLTKTRRWDQLAAVTAYAAMNAEWAVGPARVALLLDLSRLYRTRLDAPDHAEEALVALANAQPAHAEAVEWLVERYLARGDARAAVALHRAAIPGTWDPDERRHHTVAAATIAVERLDDAGLAADAWEDLWRVGDGGDEAERELTGYLRLVGNHGRLAEFIAARASTCEGADRRRALREAAALFVSAGRSSNAIEALQALLQERPDDPVAIHRLSRLLADTGRWDELESLDGGLEAADASDPVTRDRTHRVAAALEAAGRRERAAVLWRWLVETDSEDHAAATSLRDSLRLSEDWTELVAALLSAAESTRETRDEVRFLIEAAEIAEVHLGDREHALTLTRRRIRLDGPTVDAMRSLERLARAAEDEAGILEALVALRDLVTTAHDRIEVLQRLARHHSVTRGDDEAARDVLTEILQLDAENIEARDQLVEIHERRGDHEALDSALDRQLGVTSDVSVRRRIARRAATNVDAAFDDADRSVAAWRRVLDGEPRNVEVLSTLASREAARGRDRDARFLREVRIGELDGAAALDALEALAADHRKAGDAVHAAACLERVVVADPHRVDAWLALADAWMEAEQPMAARAALEDAGRHADPSERATWIRRVMATRDEGDAIDHWTNLRRLWRLGALTDDERADFESPPADRVESLLGVLFEETMAASGDERDVANADRVAALQAHEVDPARALSVHLAGLLDTDRLMAAADDTRLLAQAADDAEMELATLDRLAELSGDPAAALQLRLEAARHANERCGSVHRSFARFSALAFAADDPSERLDDLRELATAAGLDGALVEVLTELMDRETNAHRIAEWLAEIRRIENDALDASDRAFVRACQQLRCADPGVTATVLVDLGRAQNREVVALAVAGAATGDASATVEVLSDEWRRVGMAHRGFDLEALAFLADPADEHLRTRLVRAADLADAWPRLVDVLRHGAALAESAETSTSLLEHTASVCVEHLGDREAAVAIHRQILSLHPDAERSLAVLIDDDRSRERWWDLRDRLLRWSRISDDGDAVHAALCEVAEISEQRLDDDETALRTLRRVVEARPDDEGARARLLEVLNRTDDPALRLEARRLDAATASDAEALDILLDIARIERDELEDRESAIATLEDAIATHGVGNAAAIALVNLYIDADHGAAATQLLLRQADDASSTESRLGYLDRVIERAERSPDDLDASSWERVLSTLVESRPDDAAARRRLASHRLMSGDVAGWVSAIEPLAVADGDAVGRSWALLRARALAHDLDQAAEAASLFAGVSRHPALASLHTLQRASASDTRAERESLLRTWAGGLEAPLHALVLCALAEAAEEDGAPVAELAEWYREARTVDPACGPAMEALKGIGRRVRQLRPASALLPEDGERELSASARADRLLERYAGDGDADWLRRAIALDPDQMIAWDHLAAWRAQHGDRTGAAQARVESWLARCRTLAFGPDDAMALERAAQALDLLGHERLADAWLAAAHHLDPARPEAAVVVAERSLALGRPEDAKRILDRAVQNTTESMDPSLLAQLLVVRGRSRAAIGDHIDAREDFAAALASAPGSPDALDASARALLATRPVEALDLLIQSAALDPRTNARSTRLFDVGRGFEDVLGDEEEAGPWYVGAYELGLEDRELMHRVFRHFQRIGRLEQGLDVVDDLLASASETDELATLWIARGHILADRGGARAASDAVEAFDMALSYDPGRNDARHGLVRVLEGAEEWDQLAQVLEAIAEGSEGADRAMAYLRMADIMARTPGDDVDVESLLRRSIDAHPTPDAIRRLESICADRDPNGEARLELLGLLVQAGPPWYGPAIELGRLLLETEPRRAWCLLAPALTIRSTDDELKARLRDMRRECERPPLLLARLDPTFDDAATAAIFDVLKSLSDRVLPAGESDPIDDLSEVSVHSNIGRTFAAMARDLAGGEVGLFRGTIVEPVRILVADSMRVVVRADVFQQMARAEIGFVLRYALALLDAGARPFFSTAVRDRRHLIEAVLVLAGIGDAAGEQVTRYVEAIADVMDDEQCARVAEALTDDDRGAGALASGVQAALLRHARRVALIAGADLSQVARLLARMTDDVATPGVYAMDGQFDAYLAESPAVADLVVFAASEMFANAMASAEELTP